MGEGSVVLCDDAPHELLGLRLLTAVDLDEQTLLQRACAYASRVESLQNGEHTFNLALGNVDVVVDGELVADGADVLVEEAVGLERADEVFEYGALGVGEL